MVDSTVGTTANIAIHPLNLTFNDSELERTYRDDYSRRLLVLGRRALLLGCVMFGSFGPLDASVIPEAKLDAWFIRYAIVCPFILLELVLSYSPRFARHIQSAIALAGSLAGLGIVAMIVQANSPAGHSYYAGLSIVTLYIYIFSRLRFVRATQVSWGLLFVYVVCAIQTSIEAPVLISNLFFLVGTNVFCMSASYSIERSSRTDFLHQRTIRAQGLHLAEALSRAEAMARQDPLTGLPNRRSFLERAERALTDPAGLPLSVMVLDLDHFKSVNDRHGHDVGDRVLQAMAEVLPASLRAGDLVCRWGGEEFAALLPATSSAEALQVAERLRLAVQSADIRAPGQILHVTISIGMATQNPDEKLHELFKRADLALYRSKRMGRNRVTLAAPNPEEVDIRVA